MNNGTEWAFDIETDVNAEQFDSHVPAGLDPRAGAIISAAWGSVDTARVATGPETQVLTEVAVWLHTLGPGDTIYTWNGGGFDWPYLSYRMSLNNITPPFVLIPWATREPKYEPLPTSDGVMRVRFTSGARHVDVAWCWRQWCTERDVRWSLKSVADANRIEPIVPNVTGADVGTMSSLQVATYNLSDVDLTLKLAGLCTNELLTRQAD